MLGLFSNLYFISIIRFLRLSFVSISIYLAVHHIELIFNGHSSAMQDTCLPSLFTIYSFKGAGAVWHQILQGGPSCHKVTWTFLGFNLPELAFFGYSLLGIIILTEFISFVKDRYR